MRLGDFRKFVDCRDHPIVWVAWRCLRLVVLLLIVSSALGVVGKLEYTRRHPQSQSHRLARGMTKEETLAVMGQPAAVIESDHWYYDKEECPHLIFADERLVQVSEVGKSGRHPVNGELSSRSKGEQQIGTSR